MLVKILIAVGILLVVFLGFVSTREGKFDYKVSDTIQAPAEKIFPYLSDLKLGGQWSPYERMDPNMKKEFQGPSNQVGGKMIFDGNKDAGSGSLEILQIVPNEYVQLKLIMTKPFHAENIIQYRLIPQADVTTFTWSMSGDGGFMGKLINIFIDCEKMIQGQFRQGIANLKTVVETK